MKTTLMILSLMAAVGCSRAPEERSAEAQAAPVAVHTVTVRQAEWPAVYEASGTVKARTSVVLASRLTGYVREVRVRAGDRVGAGQVLVVLDARDLDAAFRQAEAARSEARGAVPEADNGVASAKANLDLVKITYGRMKDLFDKRSISNQEFDEAAAKLKVAQAGYEMAVSKRAQLDSKIAQAEQAVASASIQRGYTELAAPFAGTVTERTGEPGSLAAPGAPLLTIEREGALRLEASVEESHLGEVRRGQAVSLVLDALPRPVEGRVSEIVPAVDAAARSFTVKIDLPQAAGIRSGSFGRARFRFGTRKVLAAPVGAVVERGQLSSVLVAENGKARMRLVTLGEKSGESVEALSGLSEGDQVISPVPAGLADGRAVEERP